MKKADVIIAVRGGPLAKTRLRRQLGPEQRARLVEAMLVDMIATLSRLSGICQVHVVTPTMSLAKIADRAGAKVIIENGRIGLNGAFHVARERIAAANPNRRLVILPGDLPHLAVEDILKIVDQENDDITIAPAAMDGGTAAIVMPARVPLQFTFGCNSFKGHLDAIKDVGARSRVVAAPSLAYDVDRPEDLRRLTLVGAPGSGDNCRCAPQLLLLDSSAPVVSKSV